MPTAAATPLAKEHTTASPAAEDRRSGGIARPLVAEERRSARISASVSRQERRDGRYSNPPARASELGAGIDDDESAADLDAFDRAETMGEPQRNTSPAIEPQRAPAPLRPTRIGAGVAQAGYDPSPDPYQAGAPSPIEHTPAPFVSSPMVPQHPQYAPMPTDYRMVSADEMQAFRSPLSSPIVHAPEPAPRAVAPKRRVVLFAMSAAALVALALGGYLIFSGTRESTPTASVTDQAAKTKRPAAAKATEPVVTVGSDDKANTAVAPDQDRAAVATAAQPAAVELPVAPATTTPRAAAKPAPTTTTAGVPRPPSSIRSKTTAGRTANAAAAWRAFLVLA
jgi:hypothetical protein